MYHSIERSDQKKDKMGLAAPPEIFRMHMQYLKENDFRIIELPSLIKEILISICTMEEKFFTSNSGVRGLYH